MTANDLTQYAIKLLRIKGCNVWRNQQNSTAGRRNSVKKGVPDIIGFSKEGRFIAAEVKIGKDKLSPEQTEFLNDLKNKGGITAVIKTPEDAEELIKNVA